MDKQERAADRVELAAAHVRLLADLLSAGRGLQEVDRGALARVLQDLAEQLELAVQESACRTCRRTKEPGDRP